MAEKDFRALYLHVPFCASKCAYCDFESAPCDRRDPLLSEYAVSVAGMVERVRSAGLLGALETAYVGGGTPTLLADGDLARLVKVSGPVGELSFEANPESLTAEKLEAACEAGATRVSIGVQSLNDRELRALGRVHTAETAIEALRLAAVSGLDVSCDLMGAIPLQTPESLRSSVRGVLGCGVGHVSVYPLQVEEGTPFGRAVDEGRMELPSTDREADAMEEAEALLRAAGFQRYEVASYALPGRDCRHNGHYWDGSAYLGLGTGAASMAHRALYERFRELAPGLPAMPDGNERARFSCTSTAPAVASAHGALEPLAWDVEFLTAGEAAAEDLMLAARTSKGIPGEQVARAGRLLGRERVLGALRGLERDGLLARVDDAWRPTERGWLLGNVVFGRLWSLASE